MKFENNREIRALIMSLQEQADEHGHLLTFDRQWPEEAELWTGIFVFRPQPFEWGAMIKITGRREQGELVFSAGLLQDFEKSTVEGLAKKTGLPDYANIRSTALKDLGMLDKFRWSYKLNKS